MILINLIIINELEYNFNLNKEKQQSIMDKD